LTESLRSDELTISRTCRVWRSTLILSIASCYIMWGKSDLSLALRYPLFPISSNPGDAVCAVSSKRPQIPLSPPPSLSQLTNPFLFLTHSQHKLAYTESSTNSVLHSNHIPLSMAPAHPTENELFPKLGRLVGGMN
jgi:hypothetical protein